MFTIHSNTGVIMFQQMKQQSIILYYSSFFFHEDCMVISYLLDCSNINSIIVDFEEGVTLDTIVSNWRRYNIMVGLSSSYIKPKHFT